MKRSREEIIGSAFNNDEKCHGCEDLLKELQALEWLCQHNYVAYPNNTRSGVLVYLRGPDEYIETFDSYVSAVKSLGEYV